MEKLQKIAVLGAFVLALLASAGEGRAQAPDSLVSFDKDEITVETAAGGSHVFDVELAVTPEQRSQGLMFRQSMPANAGMLFLFERSEQRAMWMKNTFIPLDMLFIDEGGVIVRIHARSVPFSLQAIASGQPVIAVLELNAGTAARLSIKPGDRVLHGAFESGS